MRSRLHDRPTRAASLLRCPPGGRDSLVDVVTAGGTRLHVRAGTHLQPGANVFVHVPAERVLVYPAEA